MPLFLALVEGLTGGRRSLGVYIVLPLRYVEENWLVRSK